MVLQVAAPKETDFSDAKALKAVAQEDWFQQAFGKAVFISRTKPQSSVHQENLKGVITHQRKRYWVIAKASGRQQGEKSKVSVSITIPEEVKAAADARAEAERCYFSNVVEAALTAYLGL